MSDFDAIRALREEVSGMREVARVISVQARDSEAKLAEAEARHNAMLKLDAFMKATLAPMVERLTALEAEAVRNAGDKS